MDNHKKLDLGAYLVPAPKENGIPISARIAPDVKDLIARIIGTGWTGWKKESDFVRSAVWLLIQEIQPHFADGGNKDSVGEEIRLLNLHAARARRLSRLYDHERFINTVLDVARKSMARGSLDETANELVVSLWEARGIHARLAQTLAARLDGEPGLVGAWAKAKAREAQRIESERTAACECGHRGEKHGLVDKGGDVYEGCTVKGCACDAYDRQGPDEHDMAEG